jgi:hypothetical protein
MMYGCGEFHNMDLILFLGNHPTMKHMFACRLKPGFDVYAIALQVRNA